MSGSGSIFLARLELRGELEEEAQFADFDGLFHDVHAVEVVDDDGLEDEVVLVRMARGLVQDGGEFFAVVRVFFAARFPVVEQGAHSVEAGAVERLKDVERGEEERAGAAGGIEHSELCGWL